MTVVKFRTVPLVVAAYILAAQFVCARPVAGIEAMAQSQVEDSAQVKVIAHIEESAQVEDSLHLHLADSVTIRDYSVHPLTGTLSHTVVDTLQSPAAGKDGLNVEADSLSIIEVDNLSVEADSTSVKMEDSVSADVYSASVKMDGVSANVDSAAVQIGGTVRVDNAVVENGVAVNIDRSFVEMDAALEKVDSAIVGNGVAVNIDSVTVDVDVKVKIDSVAVRDSLLKEARTLRKEYAFSSADSLLAKASAYFPPRTDSVAFRRDSSEYSSLEQEMLLCENGINMSRYVTFPEVVARRMFSLDDFFLWYPLPDRSWISTPDTLDSGRNAAFKVCYVPQDADRILFSSTESSGCRSIYSMAAADTEETVFVADSSGGIPQADSLTVELAGRRWGDRKSVFGKLTSSSDEIFPMLSPDGNTVWFASSGLYGVGGYDLYESQWNAEAGEWSVPVNMGFPFSSPANDYLLTVTPDEKYMIFASDRGCPKDSVLVYVLVYDPVPVKSPVDSPEELRSLAELSPNVTAVAVETVAVMDEPVESEENKEYTEKMNQVRALRDSIHNHGVEMDALREEFVMSDDDDRRQELTMKILSMEKALPALQAAYAEASEALQKIEMEFLFNGVFIDAGKAAEAADRKVVSASSSFVFTKKSMGSPRGD